MSKPEELSLNSQEVQSVEEHLSRNELKEVWQIIQANCQKLPSLLNEEIKGVFQDAFNAMSSDFASLLEKVEVNSQETWERFKDFFENFMEALKPVQEAIVNGAKEAWGQIVKIYDIVATYCDKKIKEFSTAVVDLAQETKNWVETTGASAFKKAGQDIGNFASDAASQTKTAFKKAGQDIGNFASDAASQTETAFKKAGQDIESFASEAASQTETAFKKAGQDIGNFASDATSQTESAFKKAGQDIGNFASDATSQTETAFKKAGQDIGNFASDATSQTETAFKKAGQDIESFASDAASQTETAFKKAGQDIDSLARSAASEGENTFQKIEKEVKSWVEKIEKIFKSNDRER